MRFKCLVWCALVGCLGLQGVSLGAQASNLISDDAWQLVSAGGAEARMERVAVKDGPDGNSSVIRVTISKTVDPFYSVMLSQSVKPPLAKGRRVRLSFWARSSTGNRVHTVLERNGPPFVPYASVTPTLTSQWRRYVATAVMPVSCAPDGAGVRLQMGYKEGVVEITGVALQDMGPDPQVAAAAEAIRPDAVQARIRQYRMADLTILVRDASGRPVPDATVHVQQLRHAFLFGCNIFGLQPDNQEEWQKGYQRRFVALFNYATLPFYWGSFEPEQGKPQYDRLDAMAKWCADHGLAMKGHPLVWHDVYPRWAPTDPDEAIPLLKARVFDIIRHYGNTIHYWDVVNEANSSPDYPKTGTGAWALRDGPAKLVGTALDWAREASKGLDDVLIYNDFNTGQQNLALLSALEKDGKLPDAIGLQSHMHGGVWPLEEVWNAAQRFARFGKPIHFTEVTVVSGPRPQGYSGIPPRGSWLTTPDGEAQQADYLASFYTILFSHPLVQAITYWDFSDRGAWQNAPAGLLRADMSPKPVYDRLMKLIHGEWWTKADGKTDGRGSYKLRAFYGEHRVTVTAADGRTAVATVPMPMGSGAKKVTVVLK